MSWKDKEKVAVKEAPEAPVLQEVPSLVWVARLSLGNGTQQMVTEFPSKEEAVTYAKLALTEPVAVETPSGQTHFYPSSRVDSATVEQKAVAP